MQERQRTQEKKRKLSNQSISIHLPILNLLSLDDMLLILALSTLGQFLRSSGSLARSSFDALRWALLVIDTLVFFLGSGFLAALLGGGFGLQR